MPRPVGFQVLIKPDPVEKTTKGGIIVTDSYIDGESYIKETGEVVDIGPIAFYGYAGVDGDKYPTGHPRHNMAPNEIYGVRIGDRVEYHRGQGKLSKEDNGLRYIPDNLILGVL
jgi:hypothetical protein